MQKYSIFIFFIFQSFIIKGQLGFTTNNAELESFYIRQTILTPTAEGFQDVRPFPRNYIGDISEKLILNDSSPATPKKQQLTIENYLSTELSDRPHFQDILQARGKKTHGFFYPNPASFMAVDKDFLKLRINPILELKAGRETPTNDILYQNTRGVELQATINDKLFVYTQITENQLRPYQYIQDYGSGFQGQNNYNFNPYYTYWKELNSSRGYDFSNAIGYLEYRPSRFFSAMLGHDRNQFGYGDRSLLLGDQGAPYFQLKLNAQVWKFHYQALFAEFTGQYIRGADRLLPKKYGAFHLLTYKPTPKLEIGAYEGIIFHRSNGYELNYLNPIIFYHSIEHALGSEDNAMIGFQAKYHLTAHTQLYTQLLLDDIQIGEALKNSGWWGNKYGIQLGSRFINIGNISQLDGQLEMNIVRPYTYSHNGKSGTDTIDNFTHYNQPLAHPFGANFIEFIGKLSYKINPNFRLELYYNYSERGQDSAGFLMGNNIFSNTTGSIIPREFNNVLLQGNRVQNHFITLRSQYQFYHNMFFDLDILYRLSATAQPETQNNTIGFLAGIRVNLRKREYTF